VGLNAVRELCARCPLVMNEELLQDLAEYKTYKDKSVMMASKSLIMLFRNTHPELLHKKDRGKPTEAMVNLGRKGYGEAEVYDYVPGAEVLDADVPATPQLKKVDPKKGKKRKYEDDEDSDSENEEEWEDMSEGEAEAEEDKLSPEEKAAKAKEVTFGRILTDDDFRRIDQAQLKKQVTAARKHKKQKTVNSREVNEQGTGTRNELVALESIELIHGSKKNNKEERMASIRKGREDRGTFGGGKQKMNEFSSTSNKMKEKKKNFSMTKHNIRKKVKRSFRDKQMDLRKRLVKQDKFNTKS